MCVPGFDSGYMICHKNNVFKIHRPTKLDPMIRRVMFHPELGHTPVNSRTGDNVLYVDITLPF